MKVLGYTTDAQQFCFTDDLTIDELDIEINPESWGW